jgi:hypothetical protein
MCGRAAFFPTHLALEMLVREVEERPKTCGR